MSELAQLRRAARERFDALAFPTTRDEEWKFTSVAPIARAKFQPAPPANLTERPETLGGVQLVFVNGRLAPHLSTTNGIEARSLSDAIDGRAAGVEELGRHARFQNHAFVALNTASFVDGAFVRVPRGVLERPVHLVYVSVPEGPPAMSNPRSLILCEGGAQATLVETYLGLGQGVYFTNAVTEIVIGENAVVEHIKLQQESLDAYHVATLQVRQDRSSSFTSHSISLGGALVRNDVNATLAAEGAESTLNGLYLATGRQHIDNHTTLDHAMPHCSSRELYKGILDGRASAVFNGKIIVRPDAQKTDSKQTNKNLLLSEDATINTKPQLEIYADDVKCTHGATIGQLGEEALFYLRSRGIGLQQARSLLTYAFAGDLLSRLRVEGVRARLDALLLGWLEKGRAQ